MHRFLLLLIVGALGIGVAVLAVFPHKEAVESLVMPGSLSGAHARYENQCLQCHSSFKKGTQNDLCLNCHRDIKFDIVKTEGFHGRSPRVLDGQCRSCHTEHKGRDFSIISLDKETFDHGVTDYPLSGAHARLSVSCDACHVSGKKFREAPTDCFGCHASDDKHQGSFGKQCGQCHRETSWQSTYFDHERTRFPLTGQHQKVACETCHTSENFKQVPLNCLGCHLVNDVHDSPQDERCDRCHDTAGWKNLHFDHNKETKFELKDRHVQAACLGCHQHLNFKTKPSHQCSDCHSLDDVHRGRNGNRCEQCHNIQGWNSTSFDHNRDTKFKLAGAHANLQCRDCHRSESKDLKIDSGCVSCHQADDVHQGQEGNNCNRCHNPVGWKDKVRFDHDLAAFPLIGIHAVTSCGECHQSQAFKDAKMECSTCHAKDDYHKKALGSQCQQCHNPNGWKLWAFDHDRQTNFKLEGGHEGLKCESCHQSPMSDGSLVDSTCLACHQQDDVHKGRYGGLCERCHNVESFKKVKMGQ